MCAFLLRRLGIPSFFISLWCNDYDPIMLCVLKVMMSFPIEYHHSAVLIYEFKVYYIPPRSRMIFVLSLIPLDTTKLVFIHRCEECIIDHGSTTLKKDAVLFVNYGLNRKIICMYVFILSHSISYQFHSCLFVYI